ncbi:hypothetical protein [Bradyrhizobium sp. CCBAU 51627]|uniref:hypothetical protein n=1 Tax=Bradyrhizobium sp. CCBAU 51627 TaxID=1325088 RepID=UPI0023060F17|nr:hypothetical protein [Bradyrhizobium sp. CCBAU 51627]
MEGAFSGKDGWDFVFKTVTIILSLAAFSVALYTTTLGPKNTLHAERIKLVSRALESTNAYGWELGAFVGVPDREAFTDGELHSGEADKIVRLFNLADADLVSLELILPDRFTEQIKETKSLLLDVQLAFQGGKFSELATKFGAYRTKADNLRSTLRVFLVIDGG